MAALQEALDSIQDSSIRHIVSLSGGKDSAALALYLQDKYPEIPAEYVFCDTGAELEETYEYLDRLEAILGAKIERLSALDLPKVAALKKPNRSAFDIVLNEIYGGYLPNPRARWCTRILKIEPFEHFVGDTRAFSYIGIRGDENREGYVSKKPPVISLQPNIIPVYPFKDNSVTLRDVRNILDDSGLGLPKYYEWRSRSGCYFCFYQQIGEWQGLQEKHPDLFTRAATYEEEVDGRQFTWVEGKTLETLASLPKRHTVPDPDSEEGCAICHL